MIAVYIFIFSSLSPYRDFLYHSYLSSPSLLASGYSWNGKYLSVKVVPLSGSEERTCSSARCRRRRARYVLYFLVSHLLFLCLGWLPSGVYHGHIVSSVKLMVESYTIARDKWIQAASDAARCKDIRESWCIRGKSAARGGVTSDIWLGQSMQSGVHFFPFLRIRPCG